MRLAIVTVTFNSSSVIEDFLKCCKAQTVKEYLLIIVDNLSKDHTLAIVHLYEHQVPMKILAEGDNHGVARGNNLGISFALDQGADFVLLLNNDVTFEPDFFGKLIAGLEGDTNASALVPQINFFHPHDVIWYGGGEFSYWRGPMGTHGLHGRRDRNTQTANKYVDYAPTCAMLLRQSIFADVGMMDEKYFVYFDDTDFCYRMKKSKKKIAYTPSTKLYHKVSFLTGGEKSSFTIRMFSRNQIYFVRKHFGPIQRIYFYNVIRLKNIIRFFIRKDSLEEYRLRCTSMREGRKMSISD